MNRIVEVRSDPSIQEMPRESGPVPASRSDQGPIGNFSDLDTLFAELDRPAIIELGNPVPRSRYIPKGRAGSCPAAHNRALLSEDLGLSDKS